MAPLSLLLPVVITCQHTFWVLFFYLFGLNITGLYLLILSFSSYSLLLLSCPLIVLFCILPFSLFFYPSNSPFYICVFHRTLCIMSSVILPLYFYPLHFFASFLEATCLLSLCHPFSLHLYNDFHIIPFATLSALTLNEYLLRVTMCLQHRDLKIIWHRPCLQEVPILEEVDT